MNKYLIEIEPKNVDDAIFIWQALQTFKKVGRKVLGEPYIQKTEQPFAMKLNITMNEEEENVS